MKRLMSLVVLAGLASPCPASELGRPRMEKRPPAGSTRRAPDHRVPTMPVLPPPRILDGELLRTVLLPDRALACWVLERVGIGRDRTFSGNVIGLQAPQGPAPDLDTPIRAGFGGRR